MLKRSGNPDLSRKKYYLIAVVMFSVMMLYSQDVTIPRTKTANIEELTAVRTQCTTPGNLMYIYYNDENAIVDRDSDDPRGRANVFRTYDYIDDAFQGVIEIENNEGYLITARDFIQNDEFPFDGFDPDEVIAYLLDDNIGTCRRGLDLGYILNYITFIADMLWHYDGANPATITEQITPIAEFAYELCNNTDPNGIYMGTTYTQSVVNSIISYSPRRNIVASALGYAGLVLDNQDYVDCANYNLFEYPPIHTSWERPGILGLNTSDNDMYSSGMSYMALEMKFSCLYFTASARNADNLWDEGIVENIIKKATLYINPEFSYLTINDTYKSRSAPYAFLPYYHQSYNINIETEELIEFYFNGFNSIHPNYSGIGYPALGSWKWFALYSYKDGRNLNINSSIIPDVYSNGSYFGDCELTILRDTVSDFNEYNEKPALYISHEKSYYAYSHNDGDQGSYQLWYKGVPLLIDPGYGPGLWEYAREWLSTPYSHNCILMNPEWAEEELELTLDYNDIADPCELVDPNGPNVPSNWIGNIDHHIWNPERKYEPLGKAFDRGAGDASALENPTIYNPSEKLYEVYNSEVEHIKVKIPYYHLQVDGGQYYGDPDDDIDLFRNYYFFDNSYYIIYDELVNLDNLGQNEFCNQLHFGVRDNNDNNEIINCYDNGEFFYRYYTGYPFLHGAMGCLASSDNSYYTLRDSLPHGYGTDYEKRYEHQGMRLSSYNSVNEKFLTLLIPSEDSETPIEEISQGSNSYAVKFSLETGYNIFTAVSDASSVFIDNGETRFVTDASFFLVEVNEDFIDFKKIIVNSDNFLEIRDASGTRFDDIILFESYDGDYEEVSASYEEDVCYISLIPEQGSTPRCKIRRNEGCMTLDDEYIATHDFIYYDDNFFYIDYEGYLPPGVTTVGIFHEDLYVNDIMVIENSIFEDDLIISVSEDAILAFLGHNRFGENTKIEVNGTLSIQGSTLTSNSDSWQGIICYEGSEVWIENEACIEKAETGIYCESGEVHISNSEINLCERGIMIYNNSSLDFISSDILIPADINARGIVIVNSLSECNININGTEVDSVYIQGESETKIGKGILIQSFTDNEENSFICNYAEFKNLDVGIQHLPYCKTDHEIENCKFENCANGIQLFGTGSIKKLNLCEFVDNDYGIDQNTVAATVTNCEFNNNSMVGIEYNNTSQQGGPQQSIGGVTSSNFNSGGIAIRCADSSPRIKSCTFETLKGIESADDSKVNISYNASNIFHSTFAHLVFDPVHSNLSSEISMLEGHNNFFESATFGDFLFSSDYDGTGIEINANYNAWEDYEATDSTLTGGTPPDTIIAEFMDDWFGSVSGSPPGNRFETASVEESQGSYDTALIIFKTILNEKLESEKKYWKMSIDKVFNLTLILEEDINALLNYYEVLYQSTPEFLTEAERISLQNILKNYQKKCFIQMHEYQEAADIVVVRIDNPVSVLDSLFAVMQLESIYMLSYIDSTSRSSCVRTNYDRLAPKSLKEHNQKHKNHWDEIYNLLGIGEIHEDEIIQNIPLIPTLFGNYPNPFNPETTIPFSIPKESKVELIVYNIKGQKVKTIAKDFFEKGFHKLIWEGKDSSGKEVGSGVYFYKLKVNGKYKSVRKCLLLK